MRTIRHLAHDTAIVAALAGVGAAAMLFAKGVADAALYFAGSAIG